MNSLRTRSFWYAAAALAITAPLPARADHALVVGVGHYGNLPGVDQLDGPAHDAKSMAAKLTDCGFQVTTLTDEQATKQGVMDALQQMQTANTSGERFVFYFAGHGTKLPDGNGAILPADATENDSSHLISADELSQQVAAVPASGRTVLLDSCFSAAMSRAFALGKGLHPHRKSRYVDLFGGGSHTKQLRLVNDNDAPPEPAATTTDGGGKVCYFAAANKYQQAYEDQLGDQEAGLFTYYLVSRLKKDQEPWAGVQTDVTGIVTGETGGIQTPVLSDGFGAVPVFGGKGATPSPVNPVNPVNPPVNPKQAKSVWDQFSEDNRDPSQIRLELTPNRSTVKIGEKFKFKATPGSDGYLVLMELDTDGALNLMFPTSRNIDDAHVQAGQTVTSPAVAGKAWTADKEGAERVKAVFFTSKDAAAQLLAAFPDNGTLSSWIRAKGRKCKLTDDDPFYTSAVGFEVSAQ